MFCVRERDLLQCFVTQVLQHKAQGESLEHIATVVSQLDLLNHEFRFVLVYINLSVCYTNLTFFCQTYQLAEDLGRAFSDRFILQIYLDVEATIPEGSLKVIKVCTTNSHTLS